MGAITTTKTSSRPSFSELPLREGDPKASAWGLWGAEDDLGTLNLINSSLVKAATAEVVTGEAVPLKLQSLAYPFRTHERVLTPFPSVSLPLNAFIQPMNPSKAMLP